MSLSITIHGPDEFNDVAGFHLREKVAASRFIIAISDYARSQVMRASEPGFWKKVDVCRLGVDPDVFRPRTRATPGGELQIICVGRLAPVKAQRVLIAACAELGKRGHAIRLHLVGGGPDRSELEAHAAASGIQDQVVFHGARNQDEVIELYRQSDIFALASFAEGIPVVLMEAMAMQIPCVATWVNGVPELIGHEESGLLVAPSDEAAMVAALERLVRDPGLRQRLGEAARSRVLEQYDLSRNIQRLGEIFRRRLTD